jgi:hypothetical protein
MIDAIVRPAVRSLRTYDVTSHSYHVRLVLVTRADAIAVAPADGCVFQVNVLSAHVVFATG